MLVPLSWLKDYLTFSLSKKDLINTLTLAGLEVDKIKETSLSFSGVIVGEITEVKPHPHADQLKVLQVSDGSETFQLVCGDLTCHVGMRTAFARVNATLKSEKGGSIRVKKAKLREIESFGMLCSERELDLSDAHDMVMRLPPDTPLGTDLQDLLRETIIEISLTPNLGHCMSILGIAREIGAMIGVKAVRPTFKLKETSTTTIKEAISVTIENAKSCYRYASRCIRNVQVGPSPLWIKKRLEAAGIRSINNIVDATNYVMLSSGQPMHAFDYEKISGKTLSIRETEESLSFKTLEGEKRTIPPGTLMIYDKIKPLAIAGVMGGEESEVQKTTRHILLESAQFNPSLIRKTSKELNLRSESSIRFERGIDPEGVVKALDEAAFLIEQLANGEIVEGLIDIAPKMHKKNKLKCRTKRVNQILGTTLSISEIESCFNRLEMEVKELDEETLDVTVPSYRNDIHLEIDLIEEIARIYGYNNIQKRKKAIVLSHLPHAPMYLIEQEIRMLLLREGLQEFLTCDLISPKLFESTLEKPFSQEAAIHVLHPSSIDQSILRTSLLPGLLQAIKHNFDHKNDDLSAFEIGRIHFKDGNHFKERTTAAILMTGKRCPHHWEGKNETLDFFDLKGILENILQSFGIASPTFSPSKLENFHPGKQAMIEVNSMQIAVLGEVHPSCLEKFDIEKQVYFAQLDLHDLHELKGGFKQMTPLPQFPGSDRDWTITIKKKTAIESVLSLIRNFKSKLLKEVYLLDLYESEKIGKDRKSITLRLIYRSDQKTLKQKQVEKEHARLTETVSHALNS